jgi:phospholipid-binding lipoprotein MlaA
MFTINDRVYFWMVKPATIVYAAYFPPGLRIAVRNGFRNLIFPERFINSLLQKKPGQAGTETARFLINSTLGLGGLVDVAGVNFGIQGRDADFGQTLALWGVRSGPFLMFPVVGPSNPRDLVGYGVDSVTDPIFWIPMDAWVGPVIKFGKITNNTSLRAGEYEDFKKSALDPYIAMRDAWIQYREHEIHK